MIISILDDFPLFKYSDKLKKVILKHAKLTNLQVAFNSNNYLVIEKYSWSIFQEIL